MREMISGGEKARMVALPTDGTKLSNQKFEDPNLQSKFEDKVKEARDFT